MNNFSFKNETFRKLIHLLILILPLMLYHLGRTKALFIIVPITLLVVAVDYYRNKNAKIKFYFEKFFKNLLRDHEANGERFCGATWALIATTLIALSSKVEIAVTALTILAISDSFAAIIGKSIISKPFFEKSVAGSSAFFISGLAIIFFCGFIFSLGFWFYMFGIFALFCTTIIEARPNFFNIDDNFSVPVSFAIIMTVFDLMWNYSY